MQEIHYFKLYSVYCDNLTYISCSTTRAHIHIGSIQENINYLLSLCLVKAEYFSHVILSSPADEQYRAPQLEFIAIYGHLLAEYASDIDDDDDK